MPAEPTPKPLSALGLEAEGQAVVTGISVDSRDVKPGHIFAALPGSTIHGGEFISFALRMGAGAILTDAEGLGIAEAEGLEISVPVVVAEDPRLALARAAAAFHPGQPPVMVAVTGTNGKTSVASFCRQIWAALDLAAVNFGTTGVEGAVSKPLRHTTPEPITLHKLLAELEDDGVTHAAMEASSHGLAQRRLDGVRLAAAGFTNLSRDHLDYHPTFEHYFASKCGLFDRVLPEGGAAVINIEDEHGASVAEIAQKREQKVMTVGKQGADLSIIATRADATGQGVRFTYQGNSHVVRLELIGDFQASNVMVAAGLVIASGQAPDAVFGVLDQLRTVRGRMDKAAVRDNGAAIFVDYSHTPASLATALAALRPHVIGRLIVVFGAGGDRDPGKRILMGQAAAEHADVAYVTDDNPRSEDPASIRAAVMEGCPEATEIGDRAHAILAAVDALQAGDALLIAGKGHETGQIIGQDIFPFDDAEQASIAVAALEGRGA